MKTKLKTIFDTLCQGKGHKILLIALPLLTLVLCAVIILPQLMQLKEHSSQDAAQSSAPSEILSIDPSTPEPVSTPAPSFLSPDVSTQANEILISLKDEKGAGIDGRSFEISLIDEAGNEFIYFTSTEGTCRIVELEPGEYRVIIPAQHGCMAAEKLCTVGKNVVFTRISDTSTMRGWSTEITDKAWKTEAGKTYFIDSMGKPVTGFVRIEGKLYYFNEQGEKAAALGVDVSYYNGSIDWEKVKADGIDFVIIRTGGRGWSSGLVYEDSTAYNYILDAKRAGLDVGIYFYSTAISPEEAVTEARAVLARLNNTELEYPIYIDMEYSGQYPGGRADTLSKSERMEIARAFFSTVESSGYKAGIYSSQYYLNTAIDHWSLGSHSIWIANYIEGLTRPDFYGKYDIWQFTDKARISGIIGPVDMNILF